MKLFEYEKQTSRPLVTVQCAGCPTTATIDALSRRGTFAQPLPLNWVLCQSDSNGRLLAWCGQCYFEGRHERKLERV